MSLEIPVKDFKAFLFDCDGTIADSMPLHFIAWQKALAPWKLAPWKVEFSEELFYAWAGVPTASIVDRLNKQFMMELPIKEIVNSREQFYFELLPEIKARPEVVEVISSQYGKLPMAVVSGSPRDSVLKTLRTLNLLNYFDVIICAEDVPFGKPHPDCFLLAASKLKVPPQDCLVFEDGAAGIQAARSAGMAFVLV